MNNRGFTLIELLVVVGIVSILAAIAVPSFREFKTRAYDAEVKNDIGIMLRSQELYYTDNLVYIECTDTSDCKSKLPYFSTSGNDVDISVTTGSSGGEPYFVVTGTHDRLTYGYEFDTSDPEFIEIIP